MRGAVLAAAVALSGCAGGAVLSSATVATATAPRAVVAAPVSAAPAPRSAPPAAAAAVRSDGRPHDAFVLLSGGGTPLSNNYSQYLQAQAVAAFFTRQYPTDATWIFFGVGNRADQPPRLADARRQVVRDGLVVESWVPGVLPQNRPATREAFLRTLREEILPTVRDGGTLFLFIGDHGELTRGRTGESAVTLWKLEESATRGWSTNASEVLSVSALRETLAAGLGRGRVVFCMTQCHAGGFHFLGLPREVVPPADWFTTAPAWVMSVSAQSFPLAVAGFTATDEPSLAAGCDPDPTPGHWAGYERFLPESLFGTDLMTGARVGPPLLSFAAAHEAATLRDPTIDKPRSTAEQFLAQWAAMVETKLAHEPALTNRARLAVASFTRSVDTGEVAATDSALEAKRAQFARFTARLAEELPVAKDLLLHGTRAQLEAAIAPRGGRGGGAPTAAVGRPAPRGVAPEIRKAWTDTLRPAWKTAVQAGTVPGLSPAAREFEQRLLTLEDRGRDFVFTSGDDALLNELYWRSGYAHPESLDPAKAEAVVRWGVERRPKILSWALSSKDPAVRDAAAVLGKLAAWRQPAALGAGSVRSLSRRTAAERVLFYRRVLAAWQLLLALQANDALATVTDLSALEQTPLPAPMAPPT
jgi:hypothetical protein